MKPSASIAVPLILALTASAALAKLPPPSDEAKAKADETRAKAAHGDKLAVYQLCQAMDRVAAGYFAAAKKAGKPASAPAVTAACADPGPFVYAPPGAASAPAPPPAVAKK